MIWFENLWKNIDEDSFEITFIECYISIAKDTNKWWFVVVLLNFKLQIDNAKKDM